MEDAIETMRLLRRIAYFVVGATLYWAFARGVRSNRGIHVLLLFLCVQVVDIATAVLVFAVPVNELFEPWALARSGSAALVGLGLAALGDRSKSN